MYVSIVGELTRLGFCEVTASRYVTVLPIIKLWYRLEVPLEVQRVDTHAAGKAVARLSEVSRRF